MSNQAELTAQALTLLLTRIWRELNGDYSEESLGFFLENGVIFGGELTLLPNDSTALRVSEMIISFERSLLRVNEKTITLPPSGAAVYYLDFTEDNGFTFGQAHPGQPYIPLWTVNTDASGKVVAAGDRRGSVGNVKIRPGLLDLGPSPTDAILTETLPKPEGKLRGQTYQLIGTSGRPDEVYQCMKLGNDAYDWVQIL